MMGFIGRKLAALSDRIENMNGILLGGKDR